MVTMTVTTVLLESGPWVKRRDGSHDEFVGFCLNRSGEYRGGVLFDEYTQPRTY